MCVRVCVATKRHVPNCGFNVFFSGTAVASKYLHLKFQFRLIYNENKNEIVKYVIGGLMDTKHFHIIISN